MFQNNATNQAGDDLMEFARNLQGGQNKGFGTTAGAKEAIRTAHRVQTQTGQLFPTVDPHMVSGSEVKIVVMVIDDSGSMGGRETDVIGSINDVRSALADASKRDQIVVLVSYLNRGIVVPPSRRNDVREFTSGDYQVTGFTPLFDGTQTALAALYSQTSAFLSAGKGVSIHFVVVTDGGENGSQFASADTVSQLISDLRSQASPGLKGFAILGIDIGGVASSSLLAMGLDQSEIEPIGSSGKQIRARLQLWSKSIGGNSGLGDESHGLNH